MILALDTSTPAGSVAVGRDEDVLADSQLRVRATHSEAVLPEIDRLLALCGFSARDLSAVVVGAGPGSFTGVRIAAALAKGMCHARDLELFAYSSLAAVAAGAASDTPVCAMFDARRGQVYAAGYRRCGRLEELFAPRAAPLEQILSDLGEPARWTFAGDGAGAGEALIRGAGGRVLPPDTWVPSARSLLWLRSADPDGGRVPDPASWEPEYVRLPAAQRLSGD